MYFLICFCKRIYLNPIHVDSSILLDLVTLILISKMLFFDTLTYFSPGHSDAFTNLLYFSQFIENGIVESYPTSWFLYFVPLNTFIEINQNSDLIASVIGFFIYFKILEILKFDSKSKLLFTSLTILIGGEWIKLISGFYHNQFWVYIGLLFIRLIFFSGGNIDKKGLVSIYIFTSITFPLLLIYFPPIILASTIYYKMSIKKSIYEHFPIFLLGILLMFLNQLSLIQRFLLYIGVEDKRKFDSTLYENLNSYTKVLLIENNFLSSKLYFSIIFIIILILLVIKYSNHSRRVRNETFKHLLLFFSLVIPYIYEFGGFTGRFTWIAIPLLTYIITKILLKFVNLGFGVLALTSFFGFTYLSLFPIIQSRNITEDSWKIYNEAPTTLKSIGVTKNLFLPEAQFSYTSLVLNDLRLNEIDISKSNFIHQDMYIVPKIIEGKCSEDKGTRLFNFLPNYIGTNFGLYQSDIEFFIDDRLRNNYEIYNSYPCALSLILTNSSSTK